MPNQSLVLLLVGQAFGRRISTAPTQMYAEVLLSENHMGILNLRPRQCHDQAMGVAVYQTRANKLPGTNYREVYKKAQVLFSSIKRRTKRKPYIRSAYFGKDKIFFDYFWIHLRQKHPLERARRLKYFACALDLIQCSYHHPETRQSSEKKSVILHRFSGVTNSGDRYYVQIQEHKPTGTKQLMSVFPER